MLQSIISRIFFVLVVILSYSISNAQAPANNAGTNAAGERNVIVILRDQMPDMQPVRGQRQARASALATSQSPLIQPLQQTRARNVRSFRLINAFATSVTPTEADQLTANPQVQAVVPDAVIRMPRHNSNLLAESGGTVSSATPPSVTGPATPQCNTLEPEALQVTNTASLSSTTPQAQLILDGHGLPVTGRGVKVAFIADGLDITHPGFTRPDGTNVFIDYRNFTGDPAGTPTGGGEAFGDASSIAAQDMPHGTPLFYDISKFVNAAHPTPSPCNIRVRGMAPGASLVGLNVFSDLGYTTDSTFVQAIEWAIFEDDVDVLNESFGGNPLFDSGQDPISLANAMAVKAGITVVVSSGDAGTASTIGSPATNPDVISVGGSTTFRIYAQVSDGIMPFATGYVSNNISSLSSGGFAQKSPRTVDVVAPGDLGWALCSTNLTLYTECTNLNFNAGSPVQEFGGTSESTPLTSGEAALVIQAYRSTHHDASPSPALVKQIIMSTATDLGAPSSEQGAGLINAYVAVNTALSLDDQNGKPKNQGDGLLIDQTSAQITDEPNRFQFVSFSVTNTGSTTRHLSPHLQTLGTPTASATLTFTMNPATSPIFTFVNGAQRAYMTKTFTVPAGADHLDAAMAYKPLNSTTIMYLGLLDPSGRQAAFSLPQGTGNGYGHVDVINPAAGTWTAIFFTRVASSSTSYSGPVHFTWSTEQFVPFGTVSPAVLDLAPGATKTITTWFSTPSQPGDTAAALRFDPVGGGQPASEPEIPVTVRTLVPIGANFTGTLTGGNGRAGTGPVHTYEFDVPQDAKNLNLALNISDPNNPLEGLLVDPHGMNLSVGANLDPISSTQVGLKAMQLYHENPEPGRWHFILLENFSISGNQTSLPFSARIGLNTIPYTAPELPDSPHHQLSASGPPLSVPITITNTSAVTQTFFADARLKEKQIISLPISLCSKTTALPGLCLFTYLPPEVNDAQFLAQSTVPINLDVVAENGYGVGITDSPEIFGHIVAPNTVDASLRAHEIPWSFWVMLPALIGPFGPAGAPTEPVAAGVAVNMQPFDPAVSSDSGNAYSDLSLGTNTFNPLVLAPGQSGVIHVTIKPDKSEVGQTIKGFIYLDNFNNILVAGDEVVRIPYSYTVVP
jgi:hypothetical protein